MWTPEYYTRTVELPRTVNGVTLPNDDGTFDIYINAALPEEEQREALAHEIAHIRRDHFYEEKKPIHQMEAEADGAPAKNKAPLADQGELATKEPEGIRTPDHPRIIPLFKSLEALKHFCTQRGLM